MTEEELLKKKICVVSLGCDKNTVDSERILYKLREFGFEIVPNPENAQIIIVNTCAFIKIARDESIRVIKEFLKLKKSNLEKILVVGCLPAKTDFDFEKQFSAVDGKLGVCCESDIVGKILNLYGVNSVRKRLINSPCKRVVSTPKHYAYLKIADGCSNKCSYCTIPKIRGKYVSYELSALVDEAKQLVKNGAKELILVAQDVTRYGEDLYKKHKLVELIKELSKIEGLNWIRLHYCYPEFFSDELVNEMANNEKIVKYVDIPIQHINNEILRSMNRASTFERVTTLINKLRVKVKDVSIRTSIIVGYPGETQQQFEELYNFLKDYNLDNVGFFTYSKEEGTKAALLPNQVPEKTKQQRLKKLVVLQSKIQLEKAKLCVGKTLKCVCDDETDDFFILRSQFNSPEIDSIIYAEKTKPIRIGEFCDVIVKEIVEPFDLKGEIL